MTIIEFLEARIAEDEARASTVWARSGDSRWETRNDGRDFLTPSAVLVECAAKRAIIEMVRPYLVYQSTSDTSREFLQVLAAVYKDHPDYDQGWAL